MPDTDNPEESRQQEATGPVPIDNALKKKRRKPPTGFPRWAQWEIKYPFAPIPLSFFPWLPHIEPQEVVLYLAILRRTICYRKEWDAISRLQMAKDTGLGRTTVNKYLASLVRRGLVSVRKHEKAASEYKIELVRLVEYQTKIEKKHGQVPDLDLGQVPDHTYRDNRKARSSAFFATRHNRLATAPSTDGSA